MEGRPVTEIHVVDDTGRDVVNALPQLALQAGKPFDFVLERESLRVLYHLGDYSDIRVTAYVDASGVRVNFVVQLNYYNNVVRIEGLKEPPTDSAALAAMRLEPGRAVSPECPRRRHPTVAGHAPRRRTLPGEHQVVARTA